ncbi:hypothetical protein HNQ71_002707 [Mesorhizobium sangaii]|uniref:Propionyl-coenzyme A carboxylase alpha polypeptide n=1 Tax=Mesorhizobium sangaii TaxID=505389 RepID=A0A841PIN3_9HYPH|nr:hypothetical protein [Mesorhizobium sangaii]
MKLPISPLEGEMSGRTEGGAKELELWRSSITPHTLTSCSTRSF